ncbi:hypothetical protein CHARACLAT_026811 [Characodon lateralis]|uniref:Uncharacterized protein n=1 Tax=Characodon lateralis TaxID=208331 RepID=A0ABU7EQT4_9TELE|nr:hypothetical protein [Characodon lateralis]
MLGAVFVRLTLESGQVRLLVFGSSGAWRAASLSGSAESARKVPRTGSEPGSSSRARKQDAGNLGGSHRRKTLEEPVLFLWQMKSSDPSLVPEDRSLQNQTCSLCSNSS